MNRGTLRGQPGNPELPATVRLPGQFGLGGISDLIGNVTLDDYPLGTYSVLRINGGVIKGLADGWDGRLVLILNISASLSCTIRYPANSTSSAPQNRIMVASGNQTTNYSLPPGCGVFLIYDGGTQQWEMIDGFPLNGIVSGTAVSLQGTSINVTDTSGGTTMTATTATLNFASNTGSAGQVIGSDGSGHAVWQFAPANTLYNLGRFL